MQNVLKFYISLLRCSF